LSVGNETTQRPRCSFAKPKKSTRESDPNRKHKKKKLQ
jgi:hypothetical protein